MFKGVVPPNDLNHLASRYLALAAILSSSAFAPPDRPAQNPRAGTAMGRDGPPHRVDRLPEGLPDWDETSDIDPHQVHPNSYNRI